MDRLNDETCYDPWHWYWRRTKPQAEVDFDSTKITCTGSDHMTPNHMNRSVPESQQRRWLESCYNPNLTCWSSFKTTHKYFILYFILFFIFLPFILMKLWHILAPQRWPDGPEPGFLAALGASLHGRPAATSLKMVRSNKWFKSTCCLTAKKKIASPLMEHFVRLYDHRTS